jgi:transcriptional regulator with XRE-family HTH domain/KaiC/GvpD/RAD55 family RecA-like ATPase
MQSETSGVATGIDRLDQLLGGLNIGDNVIWYDDAGSLASVFCMNFIRACRDRQKPLIYVSFDRSPKNLLDKLGHSIDSQRVTILDCFTFGKGAGSDIFLKFYEQSRLGPACSIIPVKQPQDVRQVTDAFYGVHDKLKGPVRFVFESITGMQELWGGEDHIVDFYSHSCPRLYELNTIAYWIIEKRAHSQRLRARLNQIAQVAIELSVKRGRTSLTILKSEKRQSEHLNKPHYYWSKDLQVTFDSETRTSSQIDLGSRLKKLRSAQGLSQTELAKLVGVTPSTISQVESNMIYPSLPALFKMAEVLSVDAGELFKSSSESRQQQVFSAGDTTTVKFAHLPKHSVSGERLLPLHLQAKIEPYLVELPPGATIATHFFRHKGHEFGYLLSGRLQVKIRDTLSDVSAGDSLFITFDIPSQWKNTGPERARLLWIIIK